MNYLAIGIKEGFTGGWARIPFCETTHRWIEIKDANPVIGEHGRVRHWKSACNRAVATTNDQVQPLNIGNWPLCKLCKKGGI